MRQGLSVDVANRQKIHLPIRQIKKVVKEVLEKEGKTGKISLVFVNDDEMGQLTKRFLGRDKPTDVLAFPYSLLPIPYSLYIGEIIISTDTAKKQAEEYGNSIISEITLLLIHGLLHLLGYKHSKNMEEKQDFYMRRLGERFKTQEIL